MEMCSTMTTIPDALLQFRDVRFDGESSHVHDIFTQLKNPLPTHPRARVTHLQARPSRACAAPRWLGASPRTPPRRSPRRTTDRTPPRTRPGPSRIPRPPETQPPPPVLCVTSPTTPAADRSSPRHPRAPPPPPREADATRTDDEGAPIARDRPAAASRAPDSSNPPLDPSRKPSPSPWKSWKSLSPPLPRQPSPPVSLAAPSARLRSRCSASAARASSSDAASVSAARLAPSSAASRLAALAAYAARACAGVRRRRAFARIASMSRDIARASSRTLADIFIA